MNILENEISRRPHPWGKADEELLGSHYDSLLEVLQGNRHYSSRLELQPTDYGTWKVVRVPPQERKSTILRDPEGEYKDTFEEIVEIDSSGKIYSSNDRSKDDDLIPELPEACRCKDRIDIREILAFHTIEDIISRRKSNRPIRWLDICCGNGNILTHIRTALGRECSSIEYYGVDLDLKHIKECEKVIKENNLDNYLASSPIVQVHDIRNHLQKWKQFDLVTLLNVLHEIPPFYVYDVIRNALDRCKYSGMVLIVDMCPLPHLEWKAITWPRQNLEDLISPLLKKNDAIYPVEVEGPIHANVFPRTVNVLSLAIRKSKIDMRQLPSTPRTVVNEGSFQNIIENCLSRKKRELSAEILDVYSSDPASSTKDRMKLGRSKQLQKLLWEYWAVSEAIDSRPLSH